MKSASAAAWPSGSSRAPTPCFVINMDSATGRWAHIERQFAIAGVTATRFPALTSDDEFDAADLPSLNAMLASGWTKGEVGCLRSHLAVLQLMVSEDIEQVAIFEDDILLGAGFAELIGSVDLPAAPTILKIETTFQPAFLARDVVQVVGAASIRHLLSQHRGGGGYIINRAGAVELLALLSNDVQRIDVTAFTPDLLHGKIALLQLSPAVVVQGVFLERHSRDPALDSGLAADRYAMSLSIERSIYNRIKGKLARIFRAVGFLSRGRQTVVPWRNLAGELCVGRRFH